MLDWRSGTRTIWRAESEATFPAVLPIHTIICAIKSTSKASVATIILETFWDSFVRNGDLGNRKKSNGGFRKWQCSRGQRHRRVGRKYKTTCSRFHRRVPHRAPRLCHRMAEWSVFLDDRAPLQTSRHALVTFAWYGIAVFRVAARAFRRILKTFGRPKGSILDRFVRSSTCSQRRLYSDDSTAIIESHDVFETYY